MAASESAKGGGGGAPRPHGGAAHHLALPAAGRVREGLAFAAGAVLSALVLLSSASVLSPPPAPTIVNLPVSSSASGNAAAASSSPSSSDAAVSAVLKGPRTFYDDPHLSYSVPVGQGRQRHITDWDAKRSAWLRSRGLSTSSPSVARRVVMVSGSQPEPCKGPGGDHALLRFLKNKVDYCRLHGIQLLYNTAHLEPAMVAYWAKIPAVRAAMLAHPDAEWVWWVDADAVFTDMDFALPLERYDAGGYNLVVHGWEREVYEERSWVGLNAGVFLIRNCQWALDLMDAWARMGPASPEYARWGRTFRAELEGKPNDEADDQSALVYLLSGRNSPERARWANGTLLENGFYFQGYWAEIVGRLDGVAARYEAVERGKAGTALRRRHAEREHLLYAAARREAVRWRGGGRSGGGIPGADGGGQKGWRRPFVTHFTGCQPCGGAPDRKYSRRRCAEGVRRALAFADDQVLRAYGFRHAAPLSDSVAPLPFDYPAAAR